MGAALLLKGIGSLFFYFIFLGWMDGWVIGSVVQGVRSEKGVARSLEYDLSGLYICVCLSGDGCRD